MPSARRPCAPPAALASSGEFARRCWPRGGTGFCRYMPPSRRRLARLLAARAVRMTGAACFSSACTAVASPAVSSRSRPVVVVGGCRRYPMTCHLASPALVRPPPTTMSSQVLMFHSCPSGGWLGGRPGDHPPLRDLYLLPARAQRAMISLPREVYMRSCHPRKISLDSLPGIARDIYVLIALPHISVIPGRGRPVWSLAWTPRRWVLSSATRVEVTTDTCCQQVGERSRSVLHFTSAPTSQPAPAFRRKSSPRNPPSGRRTSCSSRCHAAPHLPADTFSGAHALHESMEPLTVMSPA